MSGKKTIIFFIIISYLLLFSFAFYSVKSYQKIAEQFSNVYKENKQLNDTVAELIKKNNKKIYGDMDSLFKDVNNSIEENKKISFEAIYEKIGSVMENWVSTQNFSIQNVTFFVDENKESMDLNMYPQKTIIKKYDGKGLFNMDSNQLEKMTTDLIGEVEKNYTQYKNYYFDLYGVTLSEWSDIKIDITIDGYQYGTFENGQLNVVYKSMKK
jgi:hypothetical protein